jgi:phenylacetate-coenzyme A ligase PaaK-like adenylate-forming protein
VNPYKIFKSKNESEFNNQSLAVFNYQYQAIEVYKHFVDLLNISPFDVKHYSEIPFLPIEFFKSHKIIDQKPAQIVFKSSGTTAMIRSHHFLSDAKLYEESFIRGFEYFYGSPENYVILALLPNYVEKGNSSLVYMTNRLVQLSQQKESGFYLNNYDELTNQLHILKKTPSKKVILLGVSYALLDIAEKSKINFPELIVMETGGMKGRRKEMIREELHEHLRAGFGVDVIHSEYGMTELLSQAYSRGEGIFETPPWMKVLVRDVNDPFCIFGKGKSGGVNIIDLANYHSISFIATQDLGKILGNNQFEILGRFDQSDVRGCNLLVD